ncbi:MAG TPA: hypothetical protein PLO34_06265, partial [Pseudoxanthomonas sp.]|nr:hypothetical protein [Pseudoxanthomonas sp.]
MRRILPVLLACTAAALSPTASAQSVQRCMGPDGRAVYTDRRCDDIGKTVFKIYDPVDIYQALEAV